MAEEDVESGSESDLDIAPPVHPVPTMQDTFEESMNETINGNEPEVPDRYSKADLVTRRKMLPEQQEYERTVPDAGSRSWERNCTRCGRS